MEHKMATYKFRSCNFST